MQLLDSAQIRQKTVRMATEILERHYGAPELVLAGINNNGLAFAKQLLSALQHISDIPVRLANIRLNPAQPLEAPITLDVAAESLSGKIVIVVDDVANTGRTMFYAMKPLLEALPLRVEAAVLVDRRHKSFPVQPDYIGLALATTLQENVEVRLVPEGEAAYLV